MRIAVAERGIELHLLQRLDGAPVALGAAELRLVHQQSLGDDLPDGQARRQRAERILEHELQLAAERSLPRRDRAP